MERMQLGRTKRLNILTVPIDIVPEEEIEQRIGRLLADEKKHQIALLGLWDFIRARGRGDYATAVRTASIVIPTSKIVAWAVRFLRDRKVPRYNPFDFVIKVLGLLEQKNGSVYLMGSKAGSLHTAASNLRGSFPKLRIVGRCAGYYSQADESNIVLAIRKASPSLLLAGNGIPGKAKWFLSHRDKLAPGIWLWCGDCLEVFAGRKDRIPRKAWETGWYAVPGLLKRPWRAYRLFPYMWTFVQLIYYRIKGL